MNGEAVGRILSEKEILRQIEEAGEKAKVSFLDPDFILMFGFAVLVDLVDIVLALCVFLDFFTISWGVSIAIDAFIFSIIGWWIYQRTGKITKSKRERQESLKKQIAKKGAKLEKQLAKGIKSPIKRALTRGGVSFLGECAWLVGLIPFWTITVLLTLREK